MKPEQRLSEYIVNTQRKGILRDRSVLKTTNIDNVVCFSSNDYLGLSSNHISKRYYQEGYQKYPTGSASSSMISGYQTIHHQLEDAFCTVLNCEAGMLFSSGYTANLGVLNLLGRLKVPAVIDKSVHASIYDGIKLGNVNFKRYPHQQLQRLQPTLGHNAFITEGIFSMSGHQPDLVSLAAYAKSQNSILYVDEAHSFGIIGQNGLGAVHQADLDLDTAPLRMIPFGKSLASMGAVVVGKKNWIQGLEQAARSAIYSTAISPALAYGLLRSLTLLQQAHPQRNHLNHLVRYFNKHKACSGFDWIDSDTVIQRIVFGCNAIASQCYNYLQTKHINPQLIRYPTVSVPETGLRFCITANHCEADIDYLFQVLELAHRDIISMSL